MKWCIHALLWIFCICYRADASKFLTRADVSQFAAALDGDGSEDGDAADTSGDLSDVSTLQRTDYSVVDSAERTCGAPTKICMSDYKPASGEPVFQCKDVMVGEKVAIVAEESSNGAVVCGPGTFYFSPMPCTGSDDQVFKQTSQKAKDETWREGNSCPDGGKRVSFAYSMA